MKWKFSLFRWTNRKFLLRAAFLVFSFGVLLFLGYRFFTLERPIPPPPRLLVPRPLPVEIDRNRNGVPDKWELGLSKKFNPCMAFTGKKIWPIDHNYLWANNSPLKARIYLQKGNHLTFLREKTVLSSQDLLTRNWSNLPRRYVKRINGKKYTFLVRYYSDGPGENLGPGKDRMSWDKAFLALQGGTLKNPSQRPYPPTQYVHFFWKSPDILGIQYWFYYPFNKCINNHEGDWEHINILLRLKGKTLEKFNPQKNHQTPLRYQFFFHHYYIETSNVYRFRDKNGVRGDHVLVFVGGYSSFLIPDIQWKTALGGWFPFAVPRWEGEYSGGSYPQPGWYANVGGFGPLQAREEVLPRRLIHANDFRLVLLADPEHMDFDRYPHLSWLNLEFYSGNWSCDWNAQIIKWAKGHRAPLQPAFKPNWNGNSIFPPWKAWQKSKLSIFHPPAHWKVIQKADPKLFR
ncbi:MAG: hypothetical protein D6805_08720 [Planctomycetota bacterium]|nr:MAG: hypothetical protein D6805_08720 [Planctomycetota bacterium]